MLTVRPGQDTVLSWPAGAVDCRVVAAAGAFVLLQAERFATTTTDPPRGRCALTFLDGMVAMGWDGTVVPGQTDGELRFRILDGHGAADRRSSVRLPHFADLTATVNGQSFAVQMLDVSAGGTRFLAPMQFETDSPVHVRSQLAEGLVLDADGIIRTSEPTITAIEFTALHEASAQEIGAWTVDRLRASLSGQG